MIIGMNFRVVATKLCTDKPQLRTALSDVMKGNVAVVDPFCPKPGGFE